MLSDILLWVLYFIALYFSIFLLSIFLFESKVQLKKIEQFPKVSVIIPAWNEEDSITETVNSALNLDYPKGKLQIIAVNHGSNDRTGAILDSFRGIEVLHISRKENDNKAVAFNQGLKRVDGEFVACLDADSLVAPQALKSMLPYFMESENVAAVTPIMLVRNPKNLLQRLQKYEYILSVFIKRLASHINCIYVAPGPFSIYRTSTLKNLGGLDEKAIAEDMEIVYRLQKNHYTIRQCLDGGFSYALAPSTIKELYRQRKRWYGGSLSNLYQYRGLTLDKRYGDFGFFQMPRNIFGLLTIFTTLGLFCYFAVLPLAKRVYHLSVIKFDILPYISGYNFEVSLFDIKNTQGILVILVLSFISFFFFLYACYNVGEKFNKKSIPALLMFFTAYPLLLCCIYLIVVLKKATGRRFVWDKVRC